MEGNTPPSQQKSPCIRAHLHPAAAGRKIPSIFRQIINFFLNFFFSFGLKHKEFSVSEYYILILAKTVLLYISTARTCFDIDFVLGAANN